MQQQTLEPRDTLRPTKTSPARPRGTAIASTGKDRLESLDLLRGLAALAILALHFPWPDGAGPLPRAYLGVDLFFTLSGFVIAYSYQHRLESGMPVGRYLLARLIRLYPLYMLATLLGAAEVAARLLYRGEPDGFGSLGAALATAMFFLPTPLEWSGWPRAFFPLNFFAWSLFLELVVNVVYGLVAMRLSNRLLGALIAAGAALLVLAATQAGTVNVGAEWATAHWAFGRALFAFFAGVALFRWREHLPLPALPAWLVGALLVASFAAPVGWPPGYDLACIFLLYPLLVAAAAHATGGSAMRAISLRLGFVSYPVYVLQMPLLHLLIEALDQIGFRQADSILIGLVAQFAFVVSIATAIALGFDSPVRAWLKHRFAVPRALAPAQTAP